MRELYSKNIKCTEKELKDIQKAINNNSVLRLLVIILAVSLLFKSFSLENIWLVLTIILLSTVIFLFLISRQSRLEKAKSLKQSFLSVNQNELHIIENKFSNMYDNGKDFEDAAHPYTSDLDIFGEYSLFSFINRCATKGGGKTLASWLADKQNREAALLRQEANEELSTNLDWNQLFQSHILPNLSEKKDIKQFLYSYFNAGKQRIARPALRKYTFYLPWIMAGLAIFSFLYPFGTSIFLLLCLFNMALALLSANKISQFSNNIDKVGGLLNSMSKVLKMIEDSSFESGQLVGLKKRLERDGDLPKLSISIKKLGQLVNNLDARNNLLVGSVLNMLLLWDFRCVISIQSWIEESEDNTIEGIEVVSEMEALISLAVLKANHPSWAKPELKTNDEASFLEAENVHHPLIDRDKSVGNDFLMQNFRIGLITGSNMAGKSTFLRTVGINAILAYSGAVVNASAFKVPLYQILTYMRIKDSLQESTSTFKAELDRMKFILENVKANEDSFFLIDEMFRGTNSVDKYLGSEAVINKLVALNGNGLVATHDLQLSKLENQRPDVIKNFHFDIQVAGSEMLFDYKLKEGECKVFNASMLLENIGIRINKS